MTATTRTTRLFTVRMWQEESSGGQGKPEWRGKVQALPEGEAYYFRDWPSLVAHLQASGDVTYAVWEGYGFWGGGAVEAHHPEVRDCFRTKSPHR